MIWEGQMTVGIHNNNRGYLPLQNTGTISPSSFDYSGTQYSVRALTTGLNFDNDQILAMGLLDPEAKHRRDLFGTSNFRLQVGMTDLNMADSAVGGGVGYLWTTTEFDWKEDDVIAVRLVRTKTAPEPPTSLTATTTLQGRVDLSWNAPEDNGGSPVTGYRIERSSRWNR